MFITKTLTKKKLEELIKQSFQFLNFSQASSLGDSLKGIGFYYATASGISISLDDLKTPSFKKELIQNIDNDFEEISRNWSIGLVSDVERFQSVIDNWNIGAEILKYQIIEHFQFNDPLNTLYIMAFSGARGNMAQVRQVIGMRGLMVNQEGDIIDLPIQANFREGLSSIDYIVSSYGARKGVVDTALKTADAGYLTRRLIYIVQEITIKAINCGTQTGLSFVLLPNSSSKDLLGKTIIKVTDFSGKTVSSFFPNKTLNEDYLELLIKKSPLILFYRSALTCDLKNGICQNCYGWDLSKREMIDLGLAVGIIAAQSIGEPGTQLTMRTFHTGGIFTGQFIENQTAPCSGLFELPSVIKTTSLRTSHGKIIPLLMEDITATITSWQGKKISIFIPRSSFLHFYESAFIKKGEIISEFQKEKKLISQKKIHPVRAPFDGIVLSRKLSARLFRTKNLKITKKDSVIWLASGKLYESPSETKFINKKYLFINSAFASSKIISPFSGVISFSENSNKIFISNGIKKAELNINQLTNISLIGKFEKIIKNFHYIDAHTIIGYYYQYPLVNEKIYRVKANIKKKSTNKTSFFFITEKDIWKINFDSNLIFDKEKQIIFPKDFLTPNLQAEGSGILLEKNGFQRIYQKTIALSVPQGTLLSSFQGKFLKKNQVLAYLVLSKQKGEDIVQGLPKIEELLEARKSKKSALLFSIPSIFLGSWKTSSTKCFIRNKKNYQSHNIFYKIELISKKSNELELSSKIRKLPLNKSERRSIRRLQKKRYFLLNFLQGIFSEKKHFIYGNTTYEMFPIKKLDTFNFSKKKFSPLDYKKDDNVFSSFKNSNQFLKKNNSILTSKSNLKQNPFYLSLENEKENRQRSMISFPFLGLPKFPDFLKRINFSSRKIIREFPNQVSSTLISEINQSKKSKIISSNFSSSSIIVSSKELLLKKKIATLNWYRLQNFDTSYLHFLLYPNTIRLKLSEFIDIGRPLTEGKIDAHNLLSSLFHYHSSLEPQILGTYRSIFKLQLILLNSIQSVYRSQGVEISNIHIELILRELTSKVRIKFAHGEIFYINEIISLSAILELCKIYEKRKHKEIFYEPILFPISKASLQKDGFLTAAGFQETRFVLTKAAIEGKKDWIRGLKESVIIGRLIPAGTGFINSANYLDTLFTYKHFNFKS